MRTTSGITNMTEREQQELLSKLMEKEEKAKQRAKAYREANKEKANEWSERARIRAKLYVEKAKAAGITVTDEEVDAYLAK